MRKWAVTLAVVATFWIPARSDASDWKGRDTAMVLAGGASVTLLAVFIYQALRSRPTEPKEQKPEAGAYHPEDYAYLASLSLKP
jgi:hypothetical protein